MPGMVRIFCLHLSRFISLIKYQSVLCFKNKFRTNLFVNMISFGLNLFCSKSGGSLQLWYSVRGAPLLALVNVNMQTLSTSW